MASSSTFASGIDAMELLLKLLYFHRDRGDIKFVFLYGDSEEDV